jgi:hypothetical protein
LANTTAAATNLNMATATGFTYTGTGGFTAAASVTRTFTFGTTGGSAVNAVNLAFTGSGTSVQTLTTGSWFNTLNFGTTAFNPGTTTLNVNSLTLSSGGTFSTLTINFVGTGTINTNGNTTLAALTLNSPGVTFSLSSALTLSATGTFTLTAGTLDLNGFNLTTGIFASTNTNTRSIIFGSNNIILTHTTAATIVLSMTTATGFTWTGTGGFTSNANQTRGFVFGQAAGGSAANAPNLSFTAGASQPTIYYDSWFNTIDFTGSTCAPTTGLASGLVNVSRGMFGGGMIS